MAPFTLRRRADDDARPAPRQIAFLGRAEGRCCAYSVRFSKPAYGDDAPLSLMEAGHFIASVPPEPATRVHLFRRAPAYCIAIDDALTHAAISRQLSRAIIRRHYARLFIIPLRAGDARLISSAAPLVVPICTVD